MKRILVGAAAAVIASMFSVGIASATVIFEDGNHPQPDEANIMFEADQTGTSITGDTNTKPAVSVLFTSPDSLTVTAKGAANLQPTTGHITNLTFSVPGSNFQDFIFDPHIGGSAPGSGTYTISAVDTLGTSFASSALTLNPGDNFTTVLAQVGEAIASVTYTQVTGVGFDELDQPRVSGIPGAVPIPEPASLALLGAGLAAIGLVRRRRTQG